MLYLLTMHVSESGHISFLLCERPNTGTMVRWTHIHLVVNVLFFYVDLNTNEANFRFIIKFINKYFLSIGRVLLV